MVIFSLLYRTQAHTQRNTALIKRHPDQQDEVHIENALDSWWKNNFLALSYHEHVDFLFGMYWRYRLGSNVYYNECTFVDFAPVYFNSYQCVQYLDIHTKQWRQLYSLIYFNIHCVQINQHGCQISKYALNLPNKIYQFFYCLLLFASTVPYRTG